MKNEFFIKYLIAKTKIISFDKVESFCFHKKIKTRLKF